MLFSDRLRLAVRRGWDRVDATLIDTRFVERQNFNSERSNASYQVWEYMIEVPGPSGGAPVRLAFKEKTFKLRGAPKRGDVVPVLVNGDRTKAMFDLSDPRIDGPGALDAREKRRKERDDARFEARLAGRDPAPEPDED